MAVPVITSISPAGGSADGGTTITIAGTDLGTPTAVAFGANPATSFVGLSATKAFAVSPAGTGTVHVTLTTGGGTSAAGTDFTYGAALFTVAEARAFDKLQLASATDFPDATIIAKEAEIRGFLIRACSVDFFPTTHTDEVHSGDGTSDLLLDWPLVTSITAASLRASTTWTALTVAELAALQCDDGGMVAWEFGYWPRYRQSVKVTYVAGHATVPDLIKRAALQIAVNELPTSNTPFAAESYDAGGTSYSFGRGDGYSGQWSQYPDVMKAIRLYDRSMPGVA